MLLTLAAFVALFAIVFLGLPIALGMGLVGAVGYGLVVNTHAAFAMIGQIAYDTVVTYEFSVLPLFILMGTFVARSGLSEELYDACNAFVGHRRGGLAYATVLACGGFSAVCGSSLATAGTMSRVAMPSMRRFGYADSLAAGAIAAGGTLGILIPPSVVLILYGIITENDINKLFIAGFLPGLVGIALYVAAVTFVIQLHPERGPRGERASWPERLRALSKVWGVAVLFLVVLGGIYAGWFTPTEAAGIGASGAFLFALLRRSLTLSTTIEALIETASTTATMFFILIGALIFSNFLDAARTPAMLHEWISGLHVAPLAVIGIILLIYLVLGCVLESISMMLLTVPLFYPLVTKLGYDPIWFGIIVVVAIEISLITPPIGLNVYMLNSIIPDVTATTIFRGVAPFIAADVVRLALFVLLPGIVLFLPRLLS
jgi:C4-dicarboxylate transporter, DctM subunit